LRRRVGAAANVLQRRGASGSGERLHDVGIERVRSKGEGGVASGATFGIEAKDSLRGAEKGKTSIQELSGGR
jgi:hypothetical protein